MPRVTSTTFSRAEKKPTPSLSALTHTHTHIRPRTHAHHHADLHNDALRPSAFVVSSEQLETVRNGFQMYGPLPQNLRANNQNSPNSTFNFSNESEVSNQAIIKTLQV